MERTGRFQAVAALAAACVALALGVAPVHAPVAPEASPSVVPASVEKPRKRPPAPLSPEEEQQRTALTGASEDLSLARGGAIKPEPHVAPAAGGELALWERPVDCSRLKCVALTFDDGPTADTSRLLDTLRDNQVPATFFMLGKQVAAFPAIAARAAADGHELGNHSWDHPQLPKLSDSEVAAQLDGTSAEILKASGQSPSVIRPPYGAHDARVDAIAKQPLILWNVDPLDWKDRDTATVIERTTTSIRPGSIILMHDSHPTTVSAVPEIISRLRAQGFTLVSVSQLYGNGSMLQAHHTYSGRVS